MLFNRIASDIVGVNHLNHRSPRANNAGVKGRLKYSHTDDFSGIKLPLFIL